MATRNPFDLLGDDDGDPSRLIAAQEQKLAAKKATTSTVPAAKVQPAKLPTKPLAPAQAEIWCDSEGGSEQRRHWSGLRWRSRGGGLQGRGRTGRDGVLGQTRDYAGEEAGGFTGRYGPTGTGGYEGYAGKPADGGRGFHSRSGRLQYGGGRRGGYPGREVEGDEERPQRRVFERHSGTGRGSELKRQGSGRGNWGTRADDVVTDKENNEALNTTDYKDAGFQKMPEQSLRACKNGIEGEAEGVKQEEEEDKEMTLEEYEKIKEEKRKTLLAMKSEERKVEVDREFESMKLLSIKKGIDDTVLKLGADNEKKKDNADKLERAKKSVSINEFLKPVAGERYHSPSGRGHGRGLGWEGGGDRGFQGGRGSGPFSSPSSDAVIKFEDPVQFPAIGGK